ncbi:MAG TPA: glycosyltransferase family 4 protein [Thermoanaerobaculia bacterium]|nr:glycosyltransferase family 4 protein [Thermoanaerobaculia bacterium]
MTVQNHRALYAAFDRFPTRKGAAIHIDRFARTLFDELGGGVLYVLGGDGFPRMQRDGAIDVMRYEGNEEHFLDRTTGFGNALARLIEDMPALELAHFRDPWSGAAIALRPHDYATVYEVNALPSIELPHLYDLGAPTLEKIRALELACCAVADRIVTPSATTAAFLRTLGVSGEKIRVIPNGADLNGGQALLPVLGRGDILYFGSPQSWQGIETLIRAFARLADFPGLRLVICASRQSRAWKPYEKLAEKLRVPIEWHYALAEDELARVRRNALVSVAPLSDCARNAEQGCAPLKIVESMACGVAVVASDLPPVREIIRHRQNGWLVHPDRPAELARALRILVEHPALARELGDAARRTVEEQFTWARSLAALRSEYRSIIEERIDAQAAAQQ